MKVLIDDKEENLVPYKGNPQLWWDGMDESKVYSFSELRFPVMSQNATQVVSKIAVKTKVSGNITKVYKPTQSI